MHPSPSPSPARGGSARRGRTRAPTREGSSHKTSGDLLPASTFTTCLDIPVEGATPIARPKLSEPTSNDPSATSAESQDQKRAPRKSKADALAALQNRSVSPFSGRESPVDGQENPPSAIQIDQSTPLRVSKHLDLNTVKTSSPRVSAKPSQPRPFDLEDCPIFYPTMEEFADPMRYIRSVAEHGKAYGIVKIVPPEEWHMPFVTDTTTFRFKTRVQRLNSIEASSRAKITFLEQLYRFHSQQGNSRVSIPTVNHQPLDLWLLRKEVQKLGGYDGVTRDRKWGEVGRLMGFTGLPGLSSQLKLAYSKIIVPFENFSEHIRNSPSMSPSTPRMPSIARLPHTTPSRLTRLSASALNPSTPNSEPKPPTASSGVSSPLSSSSSSPLSEPPEDVESNGIKIEVTRPETGLMDLDEPPKNGIPVDIIRPKRMTRGSSLDTTASRAASSKLGVAPLLPSPLLPSKETDDKDKGEICELCNGKDRGTEMLLCDGCDAGYHMFCLDPPLKTIPKGQWFCHLCLFGSGHDFGFDEGEEHSLSSFQARDLAFRTKWFESHPPPQTPLQDHITTNQIGSVKVSEYDVEKEFWRLVQSPCETVEIEYGADVHSTTHGSAMPTMETHPLDPYSRDGWNLNNMPIVSDSLLRYIKSDISGMTVPWTYVGMVFSTFCWHNEDHYTYSINFMHWGETKTWYGIPGEDAEAFEAAIKSEAPDLFEAQPDLLFQLVTLMNPGRLKEAGVRVYACNQRAGEFVITFPKAYHAGFNHGLNFNEAVNFALPDWLPLGRECVKRYQDHRKLPVFSHDELLITITQHSTTIRTAIWLLPHLKSMMEEENERRQVIRTKIPNIAEELDDNDRPEDQYQCTICKVFCYLSQIACSCTKQVVCADHIDLLCDCAVSTRILRNRFSEVQLADILAKVAERAAVPNAWRMKLNKLLQEAARPPLRSLRALLAEGERIGHPIPELATLKKCVVKANEWIEIAQTIIARKQSTRTRPTRKSRGPAEEPERLDRGIEDVRALLREVELLGFDAPEIASLQAIVASAEDLKRKAAVILDMVEAKRKSIEKSLLDDAEARAPLLAECKNFLVQASSLTIHVDEVAEVEKLANTFTLVDDLEQVDDETITLAEVRNLLDRARACDLPADHRMSVLLQAKRADGEAWDKRATELIARQSRDIKDLEEIAKFPEHAPIDPRLADRITALCTKAKEFEKTASLMLKPAEGQRTKLSDARRLLHRAEKDFDIPAVNSLRAVYDQVNDLESRCEQVLSGKYPVGPDVSIFDRVRKWNTFADEYRHSFQLPQYDKLEQQLKDHDRWVTLLPWYSPQNAAMNGNLIMDDVLACTKPEEDRAPDDEYCTCICTVPVRPPPPGQVSDAVQCDHCNARFHPQCAGGSCPFCDHHHWNGAIHHDRDFHFCHVTPLLSDAPPLTKAWSPAWQHLEIIVNRVTRLMHVIGSFLAFASQPGNQRAELIPQVRHYMRKLFRIQFVVSPHPEVSFGLDLAGLHRILASQPRPKAQRKRKRPKFVFRQDIEKPAKDGSHCVCDGHIAEPSPQRRCESCDRMYHLTCVHSPQTSGRWQCPACCVRKGKKYPSAEVRVKFHDDQDPNSFVDTKACLETFSRDIIRCSLPPPTGPTIQLILLRFTAGQPENPGGTPSASTQQGPSRNSPAEASRNSPVNPTPQPRQPSNGPPTPDQQSPLHVQLPAPPQQGVPSQHGLHPPSHQQSPGQPLHSPPVHPPVQHSPIQLPPAHHSHHVIPPHPHLPAHLVHPQHGPPALLPHPMLPPPPIGHRSPQQTPHHGTVPVSFPHPVDARHHSIGQNGHPGHSYGPPVGNGVSHPSSFPHVHIPLPSTARPFPSGHRSNGIPLPPAPSSSKSVSKKRKGIDALGIGANGHPGLSSPYAVEPPVTVPTQITRPELDPHHLRPSPPRTNPPPLTDSSLAGPSNPHPSKKVKRDSPDDRLPQSSRGDSSISTSAAAQKPISSQGPNAAPTSLPNPRAPSPANPPSSVVTETSASARNPSQPSLSQSTSSTSSAKTPSANGKITIRLPARSLARSDAPAVDDAMAPPPLAAGPPAFVPDEEPPTVRLPSMSLYEASQAGSEQ